MTWICRWPAGLLILPLMLCATSARSGETEGERIMKLMDAALTCVDDQMMEYELVSQKPGESQRAMRMVVYTKGTEWRRIEFLAPGDLKGTRVLVLSPSQMYVYLPAYRKIRRVASHTKDQGFMGTAYSNDEMSVVTYSPVFRGKLLRGTDTHWTIEGTRREGQEFSYPRMEFDIIKETQFPSEFRYYNDKGELVKTETRTDYTFQHGVWNPRVSRMVDHTRNGAWTSLIRRAFKPNLGLKDSFFTVRSLQRRGSGRPR